MKRVFLAVMVCVMGIVGFVAFKFLNESERLSPQATTIYTSNDLDIEVSYSRPFRRGRSVFGKEVEFGKYWSMGTEEATEITFNHDVVFGEQQIAGGTYRLYTIPGEKSWIVALNSETGQWASFEPDYTLDIARVAVVPQRMDSIVEQLTIGFQKDDSNLAMVIKWDDTMVAVPIQ